MELHVAKIIIIPLDVVKQHVRFISLSSVAESRQILGKTSKIKKYICPKVSKYGNLELILI